MDQDDWILINLGCGKDLIPNAINVDFCIDHHPDLVHDLEKPLPFEDNFADEIRCNHILEHIKNYSQLVREIHRVLKPKGIWAVRVPEFPCRAAIADPSHVRFFVPESFIHLTDHEMGASTMEELTGLFKILVIESVPQDRGAIDRGTPGSYFTELYVEMECLK